MSAHDLSQRHDIRAVGAADDILADDQINAVVIATRHDQHAALAARALASGKAVFVEKPLALDRDELDLVMSACAANPALVVGFNRRFSPHTEYLLRAFRGVGARTIQIRVNAAAVPADHWSHEDGGRLLGEGCHFIDLASALARSPITRVFASGRGDNAVIALDHANGSVATIAYTSGGDPTSGKERIEMFGGGISAAIDDFKLTAITRGGRRDKLETTQDKGHREELARFVAMVTNAAPPPMSLAELRSSSLAAIAVLEALSVGMPIDL